jgi:hypothetical protein
MRSIVLTAACALGLGFAAIGGVSAAPLPSGLDNVGNASLIEQVQWRRGPRCRMVTRCFRNRFGRRICRTERVCRRW